MKAVCMRDCTVGRAHYAKGDVIEVDEGTSLPRHFRWAGCGVGTVEGDPLPVAQAEGVLVLGDSPHLHADVLKHDLTSSFSTIGINLAPFKWCGRIDFWASLHGSHFFDSKWLGIWMRCPWNEGVRPHLITGHRFAGMDEGYSLVHCDAPGGSAYLAIKAAWLMGYKTIFIAGVDMATPAYARFAQPTCGLVASIRKHGVDVRVVSGALLNA